MKITGVEFVKLCGHLPASYKDYTRVTRPLDIYPEHAQYSVWEMVDPKTNTIPVEDIFLKIQTDCELEGVYGPIFEQVIPHIQGMVDFLVGKNPLEIQLIWDKLFRMDRHGRTGYSMISISSIDCALWDLKGKYLNQPAQTLLGGNRKVQAYASTLGYSLEKDNVINKAKEIMDMGFTAQKWFFRYGPTDGTKGMQKNLELAYTLREVCGKEYGLMFDAWMGWDFSYTKTMLKELEEVNPVFIEEPFMPNNLEGYKKIRQFSNIAISGGEHLYTRWEIKPFLDQGLLDFVQADPSWTGGITELSKIATMCELYGVPLMPHGCTTPAGTIVCSSLSPVATPYMEFLIPYQERQQLFQKHRLFPQHGWLEPYDLPGLALDFDDTKIEAIKILKNKEWRDYNENCND